MEANGEEVAVMVVASAYVEGLFMSKVKTLFNSMPIDLEWDMVRLTNIDSCL